MAQFGDNSTIAYRASTTSSGAGGATASFTIPSSVQPGDFLLLRYQETVTTGITAPGTPSGWTLLGSITSDNTLLTAYYWKYATFGDAGSTGTLSESSANGQYITIVDAYTGVHPTSPINAWSLAGSPGSATFTQYTPQISITTPGCWLLNHASDFLASGTEVMVPPSTTLTQRAQISGSGATRSTMTSADSAGPVPVGQLGSDAWASSPNNSTTTATTGTLALAPARADSSPTGFVTATAINKTTGANSTTVTVPTGVLLNDIAVLIVSTGAGTSGKTMTCTSSGGTISYTQLFPSTQATNAVVAAGILTGVGPGETLTISWQASSFIPTVTVAWYRGYTLSGYTLGSGTVRSGTNQLATAASLTTTQANELVVCGFMDRAASTGTPPFSTRVSVTGGTNFIDAMGAGDTAAGGNAGTAIGSFIQPTAGATTATVATMLGGTASANGYGFQVAFPTTMHATLAWI